MKHETRRLQSLIAAIQHAITETFTAAVKASFLNDRVAINDYNLHPIKALHSNAYQNYSLFTDRCVGKRTLQNVHRIIHVF
jgi:hypothetical protein